MNDDRLNRVDGTTFALRRLVVRGLAEAVRKGTEPGEEPDTFAEWVGLELLDRLVKERRLVWGDSTRAGTGGGRDHDTLLSRLHDINIPGFSLERMGDRVRKARSRLEERIAKEPVFVTHREAMRSVLDAAGLRSKAWLGRPVQLPNTQGTLTHRSVAATVRHYGLGKTKSSGESKGVLILPMRIFALDARMREGEHLRLDDLAWLGAQEPVQGLA